jgi:hypothetical protein
MTIEQNRFTCLACRNVFDAEIVTDAPIDVSFASLKAIRCPKCGAGHDRIGLGGEHPDVPKPDAPLLTRARWWKARGDVGDSSLTIWSVLVPGGGYVHRPNIPYDPDDFRRCRRLLEIIPEWRPKLPRVAEKFPCWKPFADAWEELDAMFTKGEAGKGKGKHSDLMYDRMQQLVKQAEQISNSQAPEEKHDAVNY